MNMKHIVSRSIALCAILILLSACVPDSVPTDVYKRVASEKSALESTISSTQRQLQDAQQANARQKEEQAQLEGRLQEAQKAHRQEQDQREQTERHLKDAERTIARQETVTARAERGVSLWKAGAALLFVAAVVLLFLGAAAGSATRKEVQREREA